MLVDINEVIEGFGKAGWMKRAFGLRKHSKALSGLDKRLGHGLDSLLNFYKIETDATLLADLNELKKPRNYPLEAAAEKRVQAHTSQHGCTEEAAIAALQANEHVLMQMAAELSIDADELMSEIHAFRGEVNAKLDDQGQKLDEMMYMMKGMSTDSNNY